MLDWDDANRRHIARHGVRPEEVEEALDDPRAVNGESYSSGNEVREAVVGMTATGRLLFVVYTWRGERLRVVTARPATRRERGRYHQR